MKFAERLGALSAGSIRRPWWTLVAWALIVLGGLWGGRQLPALLHGGIAAAPGTSSARVEAALAAHFDLPLTQFLLLVVRAQPDATTKLSGTAEALQSTLSGRSEVRRVQELPSQRADERLFLIGLDAQSLEAAEPLVQPLRAAIRGLVPGDSGISTLLTGHAAVNKDLTQHAARVSREGEMRVLPLVAIALLLAFGALGAAFAPILTGLAAVAAAAGLLAVWAQLTPLVAFALNIVTMLGLGLGIDYALLMVARIREEARAGLPWPVALERAARAVAPVIVTSALAIAIGLAALVPVPAPDLRAMGVGGLLVVTTSALAGITLLPALAAVAGTWLEAPRAVSRRLRTLDAGKNWSRWAQAIVRWRFTAFAASALLLFALAAPIQQLRFGLPELSELPQEPESIKGLQALKTHQVGGAWIPAQVLIQAPDNESILTPARLLAVAKTATALRADPRIAEVTAITGRPDDTRRLVTAAAVAGGERLRNRLPEQARWLLSRDNSATLLLVIPHQDASYASLKAMGGELARWDWAAVTGRPELRVDLGGAGPVENDIQVITLERFPQVAAVVVGATMLALFALTRSVLIPVKAVIATSLTVAGALGATIYLCQHPLASQFIGLSAPLAGVPPAIPVLVFCVVFGLTMDYEVFLMARVIEAHREGASDADAIAAGLTATGGVITWAALIMGLVFGGFVLADLVLLKVLGLALAIGVLLDATVVRLVLVPATLAIAGRWNWWPGEPRSSVGHG